MSDVHARPNWHGTHHAHPCGVKADSNPHSPTYTRTPGPGGVSPSGRYVPGGVVTCRACIAATERHAALCAGAR